MDAKVWILILGLLHGFGKALRDTIAHHFPGSIFSNATGRWFTWFKSDWRDKPGHPFAPFWDGWHCGDFLTSLSPLLGMFLVGFYEMSWFAMFFYVAGFGFTFNFLYKFLFIKK